MVKHDHNDTRGGCPQSITKVARGWGWGGGGGGERGGDETPSAGAAGATDVTAAA